MRVIAKVKNLETKETENIILSDHGEEQHFNLLWGLNGIFGNELKKTLAEQGLKLLKITKET